MPLYRDEVRLTGRQLGGCALEGSLLPAPKDPLGATIRPCAPKAPVLEGYWAAPAVKRIN